MDHEGFPHGDRYTRSNGAHHRRRPGDRRDALDRVREARCRHRRGSPDDLTVRTGLADHDGEIEWTDRDTGTGWVLLEAIAPETWVGFRIETPVGAFAGMEAYFLGPATFDTEWAELKEIERVLLSGPETADPIETVTFR